MIFVAIIGVLGGIVLASIAHVHYRENTGEFRPWAITSAAFFGVGLLAGAAFAVANPALFSPQVLPATVSKPKEEPAPTLAPAPPAAPKPPNPALVAAVNDTWHPLAKYKGSDNGTTGTFHIKGKMWRALWKLERRSPQGQFSFFVWKKGAKKPLNPSELIAGVNTETRIFKSGDFFIEVKADNVDWSFTIQDRYDGKTPDAGSQPLSSIPPQ